MSTRLRLIFFLWLAFFTPFAMGDSSDEEKGPVTPLADGLDVVNAIIANPVIGERLREDRLRVNRMTRQQIQPGVIEFVLYIGAGTTFWDRREINGSVIIIEDERPTYADGPIEYTVKFNIGDSDKTDSIP